jgi:hypothetical protein
MDFGLFGFYKLSDISLRKNQSAAVEKYMCTNGGFITLYKLYFEYIGGEG